MWYQAHWHVSWLARVQLNVPFPILHGIQGGWRRKTHKPKRNICQRRTKNVPKHKGRIQKIQYQAQKWKIPTQEITEKFSFCQALTNAGNRRHGRHTHFKIIPASPTSYRNIGTCQRLPEETPEIFPSEMEKFRKDHHIKGSGPGGDYNGPTLKSIIANKNGKLDDIEKNNKWVRTRRRVQICWTP